jgi:excisionase family DNA binding protein
MNGALGMSTSQAAAYLGVSLGTMRRCRWADMGWVPHARTPGGQRRFMREQLDEFITERRAAAEGNDHD